jgi:hypothetical protein
MASSSLAQVQVDVLGTAKVPLVSHPCYSATHSSADSHHVYPQLVHVQVMSGVAWTLNRTLAVPNGR